MILKEDGVSISDNKIIQFDGSIAIGDSTTGVSTIDTLVCIGKNAGEDATTADASVLIGDFAGEFLFNLFYACPYQRQFGLK